ncbi:hypothetical protein ES703_53211 [subsurface metagenome]
MTFLPSRGVTLPFGTFFNNFPNTCLIFGKKSAKFVAITNSKFCKLEEIGFKRFSKIASRVTNATLFPTELKSLI